MRRRAMDTAALRATSVRRSRPAPDPRTTSTAELRTAGLSTQEIHIVKARRPFAWLRGALLVLGILTIAGVLLLLAAYRFGRSTEELADGEAAAEAAPEQTGDEILSGRSFDYTQTSEGVPLFHIQAEESRQDRDGTSYLTTVKLEIFHEAGKTYTVHSKNARVNEKTWEARLEGEVVLSGWDKLELGARVLEFRQGGQVLESVGEVEFRYPPEFVGRASHLKVDRKNDLIKLSGGVHLRSESGAERPMRLDCQSLAFQRESGILRAVGDASIQSDQQSLQAHYLTIFLTEDGKALESVRARWNVVGRATIGEPYGDQQVVEYRGEFLDAVPSPKDPAGKRVKLDGEGDLVTLSVTDLTGLRRRFTGFWLTGTTHENRLTRLEGIGDPIVLDEYLDLEEPYPLRQACAERLTASFLPEGGVSRIELDGRVELSDPSLFMSGGETAQMNLVDDSFRIKGPNVLLTSERGEVTAPQLSWNRDTGIIRATSGVRTVLPDRSLQTLRGTPLGQGSGPVQIEAQDALWTSEPQSFQFEGDVRAWRGENLLLADQLLGDEEARKLAASGHVRTVWVVRTGSGFEASSDPAGGETGESVPIEVNAERVSYLDDVNQLIYEQNVSLRQGRRTLACQKLSVELGTGGRAERMICEDDVKMTDAVTGRRVERGDRAVYTLAQDLVEIFGEKVELYDANNNQMSGGYVLYDLNTGVFKMRSRAEGLGAGTP